MHFACPSCRSPLNAFRLAAPPTGEKGPLRGIVECPSCRAPILQQPGGGVVMSVFFGGLVVLVPAAIALGAGFEAAVSVILLWSAAMTVWAFLRRWVPAS